MRKLRNIVFTTILLSMILSGIAGLATAVAQDTALDSSCLGEFNAVVSGCTVPAGEIALTEVVDRANGTIEINGGELTSSFTAGQDMNAWVIDSLDKVEADAIAHAARRYEDPAFAGFIITVNGDEYPAAGTATASTTSDETSTEGSFTLPNREVEVSSELRLGETVKEVGQNPELVDFPAGAVIVQRVTDASAHVIYVDVVVLDVDTSIEVGPGMRAVHVWYNYQDALHASRDACREANSRFLETLTEGNWNYAYLVILNDDQMTAPADCS